MPDDSSSDDLLPRALGRAARSAAPATDSLTHEDMRAFLQARVAAFAAMLVFVFGIFFVWRFATALIGADSPGVRYLIWQALAISAFAGMWMLSRGRPRSLRFIRATELGGLTCAAAGAIVMSFQLSYSARPDTILLLCLTYTLIARAIMVPSSPARTIAYGLLFGPPFLISVYFLHRLQHDPSIYTAAADARLRLPAADIARRWTVVGALWWAAAQIIATATSQVIYGLRKEVRDARRLGQYTLVEKLGEGGMGAVYLARHALLRRPSAIKLLPPERFGPESARRFEREVQLTASLSHPNTIRVFDYGRTPDGIFYYAMEYLEGAGLDAVVERVGPLSAARVIHLLDQVAGALGEAHGVGLIHRDIKPANIFLTQQGGVPDVAKVLDFGLVKELRAVSADGPTVPVLDHDEPISGTPLYMAPEAITSPEQVDARADLYALGAVGYYLISGKHVFEGRNIVEICSHHLHSSPPPPSSRCDRPVPRDLEQLLLDCLHKEPQRRPRDAVALQARLRACEDARRWDEEEARRWFREHAAVLHRRDHASTIGGSVTIAVDMRRRLAPLDPHSGGGSG